MPQSHSTRAFTLVEIMVVVVVIGLLAALAIPAMNQVRERALSTRISNDMRQFRTAFLGYSLEHDAWPAAAGAGTIPTGMEEYLPVAYLNTTEPGGAYSWTGAAGQIRFTSIVANPGVMQKVDNAIDDGDLASGAFVEVGAGLYQLQL